MPLSDFHPDLKGWTPVEPAPKALPGIPTPEVQVSPYLRTVLPLPLQYAGDTIKQYNRPGLSSFRVAPLPPGGIPSINAASAGVSKVVFLGEPQSSVDIDVTVTDGLTHGDLVWEHDSAYVELRDDFVPAFASTFGPGTTAALGELGWFLANGGIGNFEQVGGNPPYIGQVAWENTTSVNNYGSLLLNAEAASSTSLSILHRNAFALLENPGWKMTWVFKHSGTANPASDFKLKKSFYIGLSGPTIQNIATIVSSGGCARPDIFIGLRYDTSTIPVGMTISNSQAPSTFFGTFTGGAANAFAGQTIVVKGMPTAGNNGTFTVVGSTNTQIDVTSAGITSESPVQGFLVLSSIPVTAAANASGGNTVYTFIDVINSGAGANGAYIGLSFVITGFVTAANNGTFTCVQSTATTITLNNGSGVAEAHAALATTTSLNDSFLTFEVVENPQYTSAARHNKQGQTFVTNVTPVGGIWHRLDMTCSTAGVIVMTLDGSSTNTWTVTVPQITYTSANGQANWTGWEAGLGTDTVGTSGTAVWVPYTGGSVITVSGLAGGPAAMNGTHTLFSSAVGPRLRWDTPTMASIGNQAVTYAVVGYPGLTPFMTFGNDDTAAPVSAAMRVAVDYFSLVWNPNLGAGAPGTPDPTKARYW